MTKKYVSKIVKGGQTIYIKDSEAAALIPVDISTLTPSSTFIKDNIIGINGVLYKATAATSNLPVTLVVQDGAFVTNTAPDGSIAFIVSDSTVNTGWEVWTDAGMAYLIGMKQDMLYFDSTPTANSTNMVKSGGIKSALDLKLDASQKGTASGVAELDSNGKVLASQLPSYVDDVIEAYYKAADGKFYEHKSGSTYSDEITGESGKIYVDLDTNKTYRWGGSAYAEISPSLALGETETTAYRGDRGKTAYDHSQNGDVHVTTQQKTAWSAKYDKPSGGIPSTDMSSAVQTSLGKADSALQSHQSVVLASGTNNGTMKITVNGTATDNVAVTGLGTAAYKGVATDVNTSENLVPSNKVKAYVDDRSLIPVDVEALTPSSTFVKGNVIGINGTFYKATADTSNFPVTLATQGGAFLVNTIDGKRCFIVTDPTINSGWMMWGDANVEYHIANLQTQINGKQSALTFDSRPTANSNNPVTSTGIKTYVDYSCGKRHKLSNGSTLPIGYVNVLDWTSEVPSETYNLTIIPPASDEFAYEADAIVRVTGNAGWSIRMSLPGASGAQYIGNGSSRVHVIYVDGHLAVEVTRLTLYI